MYQREKSLSISYVRDQRNSVAQTQTHTAVKIEPHTHTSTKWQHINAVQFLALVVIVCQHFFRALSVNLSGRTASSALFLASN